MPGLVPTLLIVLAIVVLGLPIAYAVLGENRPKLPPAGRKVEVGEGTEVNVLESGSGEPIVLIHGISASAYDWRLSVDALETRGFRVLAYDRVGYGHSDARANGRFTFDENARELLQLLEAEDLKDVTLAGWSYGGGVAMRAVLSDASRIARLVLVGSAGQMEEPPSPPLVAKVLFSAPVRAWTRRVPPVRAAFRRMGTDFAFSGQPYPEWWLDQVDANFAGPTTESTYFSEARQLDVTGLDPAPIERPILVVHGTDDRVTPLEIAHTLHRQAKESELVLVDGGSHMLPVTHAELFAEHVATFVRSNGRAS